MLGGSYRAVEMPGEAEGSPAKFVAPSLSYRHVAYLLNSERVGTADYLWFDRSEAGAAACGINVLGLIGRPNRTFVLLFLNRHLN